MMSLSLSEIGRLAQLPIEDDRIVKPIEKFKERLRCGCFPQVFHSHNGREWSIHEYLWCSSAANEKKEGCGGNNFECDMIDKFIGASDRIRWGVFLIRCISCNRRMLCKTPINEI